MHECSCMTLVPVDDVVYGWLPSHVHIHIRTCSLAFSYSRTYTRRDIHTCFQLSHAHTYVLYTWRVWDTLTSTIRHASISSCTCTNACTATHTTRSISLSVSLSLSLTLSLSLCLSHTHSNAHTRKHVFPVEKHVRMPLAQHKKSLPEAQRPVRLKSTYVT
jgi:hypothetical protein